MSKIFKSLLSLAAMFTMGFTANAVDIPEVTPAQGTVQDLSNIDLNFTNSKSLDGSEAGICVDDPSQGNNYTKAVVFKKDGVVITPDYTIGLDPDDYYKASLTFCNAAGNTETITDPGTYTIEFQEGAFYYYGDADYETIVNIPAFTLTYTIEAATPAKPAFYYTVKIDGPAPSLTYDFTWNNNFQAVPADGIIGGDSKPASLFFRAPAGYKITGSTPTGMQHPAMTTPTWWVDNANLASGSEITIVTEADQVVATPEVPTVTPVSGSTVTQLDEIALNFSNSASFDGLGYGIDVNMENGAIPGLVIKKDGVAINPAYDVSYYDTDATFKFIVPGSTDLEGQPITDPGTYTLEFPEGAFYFYDENENEVNIPAFTLTYTIGTPKPAFYYEVKVQGDATVTYNFNLNDNYQPVPADGIIGQASKPDFIFFRTNDGYEITSSTPKGAIMASQNAWSIDPYDLASGTVITLVTATKPVAPSMPAPTANPASGTNQTSIGKIILDFSSSSSFDKGGYGTNIDGQASQVIVKKDGTEIATKPALAFGTGNYDINVTFSPAITDPGVYTITFPEGLFSYVESWPTTTPIPAFTLTYTIAAEEHEYTVTVNGGGTVKYGTAYNALSDLPADGKINCGQTAPEKLYFDINKGYEITSSTPAGAYNAGFKMWVINMAGVANNSAITIETASTTTYYLHDQAGNYIGTTSANTLQMVGNHPTENQKFNFAPLANNTTGAVTIQSSVNPSYYVQIASTSGNIKLGTNATRADYLYKLDRTANTATLVDCPVDNGEYAIVTYIMNNGTEYAALLSNVSNTSMDGIQGAKMTGYTAGGTLTDNWSLINASTIWTATRTAPQAGPAPTGIEYYLRDLDGNYMYTNPAGNNLTGKTNLGLTNEKADALKFTFVAEQNVANDALNILTDGKYLSQSDGTIEAFLTESKNYATRFLFHVNLDTKEATRVNANDIQSGEPYVIFGAFTNARPSWGMNASWDAINNTAINNAGNTLYPDALGTTSIDFGAAALNAIPSTWTWNDNRNIIWIPTTDGTTGIDNVKVAGNNDVEYYNLNGQRVQNPQHGIFIRRAADGRTSKIAIK